MHGDNDNGSGNRLWWMDREDPRFGNCWQARAGYYLVWALGYLALVAVALLVLKWFGWFQ